MVSITKNILTVFTVALLTFLTACSSKPPQEEQGNIYDALINDDVQYSDQTENPDVDPYAVEDEAASQASADFVKTQLREARSLFFKRRYEEAAEITENLVRLDEDLAEAYYWLARVRIELSDFQAAYDMASKGLTVIAGGDRNLERELERIQALAEMGAQ